MTLVSEKAALGQDEAVSAASSKVALGVESRSSHMTLDGGTPITEGIVTARPRPAGARGVVPKRSEGRRLEPRCPSVRSSTSLKLRDHRQIAARGAGHPIITIPPRAESPFRLDQAE